MCECIETHRQTHKYNRTHMFTYVKYIHTSVQKALKLDQKEIRAVLDEGISSRAVGIKY